MNRCIVSLTRKRIEIFIIEKERQSRHFTPADAGRSKLFEGCFAKTIDIPLSAMKIGSVIGFLLFLCFVALVCIDHRLHRSNRFLEEILNEARVAREHLAAMRKYYEPAPEPPPLPLRLEPEDLSEPQRESLR